MLTGVNFLATVLKMRTEGMTLFKMPVFTWNALCTSVLILAAFPILTATPADADPGPLPGHAFLYQRGLAATR